MNRPELDRRWIYILVRRDNHSSHACDAHIKGAERSDSTLSDLSYTLSGQSESEAATAAAFLRARDVIALHKIILHEL